MNSSVLRSSPSDHRQHDCMTFELAFSCTVVSSKVNTYDGRVGNEAIYFNERSTINCNEWSVYIM